jgi:predicted transcriptional regulator
MIKMKVNIVNTLNADFNREAEKRVDVKRVQILESLIDATPIDTGEASKGWSLHGSVISNNVKHIEDLNLGSSQQAPAYFIEQTVLSTPGVMPNGQIVRQKS